MAYSTRLVTDVVRDAGFKVEPSKGTELALNILVHMFVMLGTLILMFYFLVKDTEKRAITNEMTTTSVNATSSIMTQLLAKMTDEQKANLKKVVPLLQSFSDAYAGPNEQRETFNNELIWKAMYCLLALAAVVAIWFVINSCNNLKMGRIAAHVFIENSVMLLVVGCIEASFFLTIASKYIPVMPSQISNNIKDAISGGNKAPVPATQ
jgi:hypothetical protein